jgi:hypothetical protein
VAAWQRNNAAGKSGALNLNFGFPARLQLLGTFLRPLPVHTPSFRDDDRQRRLAAEGV